MSDRKDWNPQLRELGEYIRLQRQLADLSLRGLAELTNVSNAYLSQIERGLHQPSLRVLHAIAGALNISADALLSQAGLGEPAQPGDAARAAETDTEAAIARDPHLTEDERMMLIRVYRSMRHPERPPVSDSEGADQAPPPNGRKTS